MKSYKLALGYLVLAYLVASVAAAAAYFISELVMWIVTFTIGSLIFIYYFYLYLKKTGCTGNALFSETNKLIVFWIILSFLLDAFVYIAVIPLSFGRSPNWTFFIDQSPWIWMNYFTIIILGHVSRMILKWKTAK